MMSKTSLYRGAALGALLALGFGAVAQAKPVKHHHHHHAVAVVAEDSSDKAEIAELRDEVRALTDRLNAQEGYTQQVNVTAQQAQASAQQASAQAQSAQAAQAATDAEVRRIPASVDSAVAKIKPKSGWWDNTSISGRMYYDLTDITQKSDGVKVNGAPNGVNFDIKRFYLGIDHKFNDVFSANLTTDFLYDSGTSSTQLYIKKAYLQAKLNPMLTFRIGSADLPWVPFVEDIYGFRYVENVMVDRTKFGTSADWGVHALGAIPLSKDVALSYAGSVINGNGYKKPGFIGGVNHTDTMDFEGRVSLAGYGFTAAVGGYDGKLGKDVQGTATYHDATRFDALLAYVKGPFRLGGEYFKADDWADVTQPNPALTNHTEGWSGWGAVAFTKELSVFGRYDTVKPKQDTAPTLSNHYFNVGLQWEPTKIVDFSLVYKQDKINNGTFGTQNGTIGGVHNGAYDEVGLFGQIKW